VGTVFFFFFFFDAGGRQWMSMSVTLRSGTGTVTCQLVGRTDAS
jgi:hypothetical protein